MKDFWYPVAFSSEIKPGKNPLRKILLEKPIVLYRLTDDKLCAFLDTCPHRGAPLSSGSLENGELRCPYHGWKFNKEGECIDIPGMPQDSNQNCINRKIKLHNVSVCEQNNLIWINLNNKKNTQILELTNDGKGIFFKQSFPVDLEDLIENFMDPIHTVYVHGGIIRNKKSAKKLRKINFEASSTSLKINYEKLHEKVGFFQRLINPQHVPLQHSEEIHFPNFISISYRFADTGHFLKADVMLCPENDKMTTAYIKVNFNFGMLQWPAGRVIKILGKRILQQDFRILQLLSMNQEYKNADKPTFVQLSTEPHFMELRTRMNNIRNNILDNSTKKLVFELEF